jgi:23S rRNA pseudouridine955/2504/2580 synthase
MLSYEIDPNNHCRTAWSFLRNLIPMAPLGYLTKLLRSGHISLNGTTATAAAILSIGDTVSLKESTKTSQLLTKKTPRLDIVFEDSWIIACNKQSGIPMHRTAEISESTVVDIAESFLTDRDGHRIKLRPVNRLDRGTSGVVLLAKSPTTAGMLGKIVKEEGLSKLYLAIVKGKMPAMGSIDIPLAGKASTTDFKTLLSSADKSFVAVWPRTGRMHQIRQHFAMKHHPVIGDRRYGAPTISDPYSHLLHSFRTSLNHPSTGEPIFLSAPLPPLMINGLSEMAGEATLSILQSITGLTAEPPTLP